MAMKIKSKLKSKKGVSILLALLTVLVCTTMAAIIITAATASSGRLVDQAQYDKRYFAIKSAADLLEQEITGSEITIDRIRNSNKTSSRVVKDDETSTTSEKTSVSSYELKVNDESPSSDPSLLEEIALTVLGNGSIPCDQAAYEAAYEREYESFNDEVSFDAINLTVVPASGSELNLGTSANATVEAKLESSDKLILTITSVPDENTSKDPSNFEFSIIMEFTADVSESAHSKETKTNTAYSKDNKTQTVTSTIVDTKTTTIKWVFAGMKISEG